MTSARLEARKSSFSMIHWEARKTMKIAVLRGLDLENPASQWFIEKLENLWKWVHWEAGKPLKIGALEAPRREEPGGVGGKSGVLGPYPHSKDPQILILQASKLEDFNPWRNSFTLKISSFNFEASLEPKILSCPSQPGGPEGAGGYIRHMWDTWHDIYDMYGISDI